MTRDESHAAAMALPGPGATLDLTTKTRAELGITA